MTNELVSIKLIDDNNMNYTIPLDEANTDYQEYIKWTQLSPANVAAPADE